MRDIPPTAMLRAFEVATRHPTFTSSASELFITQSAVSHQLKNLEELWGLQLFQRDKTITLTPAGAALAPIVRESHSKLESFLDDEKKYAPTNEAAILKNKFFIADVSLKFNSLNNLS
mgnify:CR=1 FL=1